MGYQHGLFTWTDIAAPDPAAIKGFYTALLGWDAEDQFDPDGNYIYTLFSKDGHTVAGLGGHPPAMAGQGIPAFWTSYVSVDNADEAIAAWEEAGGSVMMPAMDVFDSGRMAFVADPEGAVIAFWQAGEHVGGQIFNVPGAMTWNELNTRDVEAAKEFYGKALGWEFEPFDSPGALTYWLIKVPGKEQSSPLADDPYNGGMLTITEDFPPEMPANWSVYFASADVDAAVARLDELGGSLFAGVMDTSAGRLAVVSDPQGGVFQLITPPQPT
ncbi:MAG: VOC family protein [Acidimicrobiia bacterium]|nr:VOC family protein [Acidimicrobiia bacterium]